MTQEEVEAIKKRLEQSIASLEDQTAALKNDLKAISDFLQKKENVKPEVEEKLNDAEIKTKEQISANQKLLEELEALDFETTQSPSNTLISDLEQRTVAMLERMQQKVNAREIMGDLYEEIKNTTLQKADTSTDISSKKTEKETIDPIEEAKHIRNEQEMESTVKKIKDQDALAELKKKLGM